jgi:hypothetical protein
MCIYNINQSELICKVDNKKKKRKKRGGEKERVGGLAITVQSVLVKIC